MLVFNQAASTGKPLAEFASLLGPEAPGLVRSYPSLVAHPSATPLHRLNALAQSLDIGRIYAKDEGFRLGLGSFKALGGAYAVARLVQEWAEKEWGRRVPAHELLDPAVRAIVARQTCTCATDGNHGRSVAAGAQAFGCKAVIFVPQRVSIERLEAIRKFGAEIVVVPGNYDDSVAECRRVAAERGWQIVSDTSWPGYETIPGYVMQGYTVMVDECLSSLEADGVRLTHIFVQAGVGGLAAAVGGHVTLRYGANAPRIVAVEPDRANCLLHSAVMGTPIRIRQGQPTIMSMLECYEPSLVAWQILEQTAYAFMDVPDEAAIEAMRRLARPLGSDPAIVAGESGSAGVAGLMEACTGHKLLQSVGLQKDSMVLVFISEGATAPRRYRELVGLDPEAVLGGKSQTGGRP